MRIVCYLIAQINQCHVISDIACDVIAMAQTICLTSYSFKSIGTTHEHIQYHTQQDSPQIPIRTGTGANQ